LIGTSGFEDVPGDSDAISDGAGRIRDLKEAIQERMAHDHYMTVGGTNADHGEHQKIIFHEPESSYLVPGENKGALYTKNVSDKAELHWTDEDETSIQITSGGEILAAVPSGGIIEWSGASDAIPNGYYLCDGTNGTPDLTNMFIYGASNGTSIGNASVGSTWTPTLSGNDSLVVNSSGSNSKEDGGGTCTAQNVNMMPPYYALAFVQRQGIE